MHVYESRHAFTETSLAKPYMKMHIIVSQASQTIYMFACMNLDRFTETSLTKLYTKKFAIVPKLFIEPVVLSLLLTGSDALQSCEEDLSNFEYECCRRQGPEIHVLE